MPRIALLSLVLLAACGGGSESPSPQPLPLRDTTPPVITLTGDNPQVITTGSAYMELGATATDNLDGNLTSSIVIDASSVDTSAAGSYSVTYNVSDTAGNAAATVTRTVTVEDPPLPAEPQVSVSGDMKKIVFTWESVDGAEFYRLLENADGHSGFAQVGDDIAAGTLTASMDISVHLFDFVNAQYILEACSIWGCSSSDIVTATDVMLDTIGYFKASNSGSGDQFGGSVAISRDGTTLAVGARREDSNSSSINGDQDNDLAQDSGAVYVFRSVGGSWFQQAYIKASNTDVGDFFGGAIALSAGGDTLAVSASSENSSATGVNGNQSDNSARSAGAVYVFSFDGSDWFQQAYIKASNTDVGDFFGGAITLSADGNTLAVGASGEEGNATGINGNQSDNSARSAGAVYVFSFDGSDWFQQAYIKASNTDALDGFGRAVALSSDGASLAVGAPGEDSDATGINGDQGNNSDPGYNPRVPGAAYFFRFDGTSWSQQAYIKASNASRSFGESVSISGDGNTLAVGAWWEASSASGVGGDQDNEQLLGAGAAYVFRFVDSVWFQQAYIKASNPGSQALFGERVSLSADAEYLVVGSRWEEGIATGVNGDQFLTAPGIYAAGAAYIFRFDSGVWSQTAYIKASNTGDEDQLGISIALDADGDTLVIGAWGEDSAATGIGSDQTDNSAIGSGAIYIY